MLAYLVIASTVRLPKVEVLETAYSKYGDQVEIIAADDIISGDFTDALRGVSALIHITSLLLGRNGTEALTNVSMLSLFVFAHTMVFI